MQSIKILVVGCGHMGTSHARAYHQLPGFEIVGLVSRGSHSRERLSEELGGLPTFSNFADALKMTRPDAVSINTYPANEIDQAMYNYGQLQVRFDDGSVGWYEAGWGPMMSETAFFIKDVIGPKGSVSIVDGNKGTSDNVDDHSRTGGLVVHHAQLGTDGHFVRPDYVINTSNEPDHDALCKLEQEYFYEAITRDVSLEYHLRDAVNSLRIVLAADESVRTGKTIVL